ncbi:MAG TPA: DUF1360 domain-containing protein [Gaiellaceae bacterium]|jgi:hypothetical protein|nr:DUF1360 domain-containing protein [Gaiellaceae bacterium]
MDVRTRAAAERRHDDDAPLASYAAFVGVYGTAFAGSLLAARLAGRDLPAHSAGDIALFGVATHKLSRLLAKDKVTAALRAPFTEYEEAGGPAEVEERPRGRGTRRAIGELVSCPYCLEQWVAGAFTVASVFAPRTTRLAAGVFATVAIADALQIAYEARQETL